MRRRLIEQGLMVLLRAGLVDMAATDDGFMYGATEEGAPITLHHDACDPAAHVEVVCSARGEPMRSEAISTRMGPGHPERLRKQPDVQRRFERL